MVKLSALGVSNAYACYIEMLHILTSSTFDVQSFHTIAAEVPSFFYISYILVTIEVKKKKSSKLSEGKRWTL